MNKIEGHPRRTIRRRETYDGLLAPERDVQTDAVLSRGACEDVCFRDYFAR